MITCDYCGHEAPLEEMKPRRKGAGFQCRDVDACDERDLDRERAAVADLRRQARASGEPLTDTEREQIRALGE